MASLMIIQGANEYTTYELYKRNSIGRDHHNSLPVPDPTLAPTQFELLYRGDRFILNNLANGQAVFVNGEEVDHRFLENGDVIQAGNVQFLFCQEDDAEPPEPPEVVHDQTHFDPDSSVMPPSGEFDHIEARADVQNSSLAVKHLAGASDAARRLSILFEVATAIGEIMSPDVLLPKLLDIVFQVFPADTGSIWLMDEGRCRVKAARDRRGRIQGKVSISTTILREAIKTRNAILTRDAMEDDRFLSGQSIIDLDIHSAMCVPLLVKNEILGVIQIENSDPDSVYTQDDLDLLSAIAVQASVSIKNAQLFADVREKERFEHEIALASRIQQSLLPARPPVIEGLELTGKLRPAREVGGDYYDFLADPKGGGVYLAIGDVTGKGLPAGLVMVMARSLLLPLVEDGHPTREIVIRANKHMFHNTDRKTFMSLLLLHWDPGTRRLVYTGAGHEHMILLPREGKPRVFRAGGMALGLSDRHDAAFVEKQIPFEVGDTLVLYTDGVTEAEDRDRKQFTLDKLVRAVHRARALPPAGLLDATLERLAEHVGDADQSDDITLVIAKRTK